MAEDSYPLAAQIPLRAFDFPSFPEQASRLRNLTLTADIKLDEYQSLVQAPRSPDETFNIPSNLPSSITHLTLELFSLGFPAGFLASVAVSLPNLKSLTLFSCLIDGISDASRGDAERFFERLPLLEDLHVLDTFARAGFWQKVARGVERTAQEGVVAALKALEVSYTYRGFDDDGFLARVGGEEWSEWVVPGAVGLAFGLVPETAEIADEVGDDGEKESQAEGILPFAVDSRASENLRKKFKALTKGSLRELKMIDFSLWTLRPSDVGDLLQVCPAMADLTVGVLMEDDWWSKFVKAVGTTGSSLEGIEVVGVPSNKKEMKAPAQNGKSEKESEVALLARSDLDELAAACSNLSRLTMTILRAKSFGRISWTRIEKGGWEESRAGD